MYKTEVVAVQEFSSSFSLRDRKTIKEAKIILKLYHPNVVKFFGILLERYGIVTEYVEKWITIDGEEVLLNDVRGFLDNVEDDFDWGVRMKIAYDSANALEYLHSQGVIHSDVKAANFFLGGGKSSSYIVKLGDFGESIRLSKTKTLASSSFQLSGNDKKDKRKIAGTIPFIAPELTVMGARPSRKSDVYSFSMYIVELTVPTRCHPWGDDCCSPDLV